MQYEIYLLDEYGTVSKINNKLYTSLEEMMHDAKDYVITANMDNALTFEEQKKNWNICLFEFGNDERKMFYAGNRSFGKHQVLFLQNEQLETMDLPKGDLSHIGFKVFLGYIPSNKNKNDTSASWYATDSHGREINSIDSEDLKGKSFIFFRKIK